MKKLISTVCLSILVFAMAKAQDAAKVDPAHYKVILNNNQVRVLDVHHKPGEKSPMHSHPNHVVYSFTDSTVKFPPLPRTCRFSGSFPGNEAIYAPNADFANAFEVDPDAPVSRKQETQQFET